MSEPLIVVPLDGSELSEGALPYASRFAKATGSRVLLVLVWEGSEPGLLGDLPAVATELAQNAEAYFQTYLAGLTQKLDAEGVEAETAVLIGRPAEEVLRLIEQRDPRLLLLATHGRSGLSRWWYGSVANRLMREAPVATLVVGPKLLEAKAPAGAPQRILVPLDGSTLAESALRPALELADIFEAEVILAETLSWAAQSYIYGVPQMDVASIDRELSAGAQQYLDRVREGLTTERPVQTKVLHGLAADSLIDLVAAERIDLVVLASHGRGGLARATLGSVAERMLQGAAPVLLIRPQAAAPLAAPALARHCHNCGRAVLYGVITPDDKCLRCGVHLRACANCVFFDGLACLLQRSEVRDTYPGLNCPEFHFRETPAPAKS
jgi:nucleotide-binding universal stress UspA family protein